MTDSFPLTAAALRKHASDFRVYEQQLALELGGLSGLQINELTFARLTKPDPLRLFGSDCGGRWPSGLRSIRTFRRTTWSD